MIFGQTLGGLLRSVQHHKRIRHPSDRGQTLVPLDLGGIRRESFVPGVKDPSLRSSYAMAITVFKVEIGAGDLSLDRIGRLDEPPTTCSCHSESTTRHDWIFGPGTDHPKTVIRPNGIQGTDDRNQVVGIGLHEPVGLIHTTTVRSAISALRWIAPAGALSTKVGGGDDVLPLNTFLPVLELLCPHRAGNQIDPQAAVESAAAVPVGPNIEVDIPRQHPLGRIEAGGESG